MTELTSDRVRLSSDVGGTFTDCVMLDLELGALTVQKTLTVADQPAVGVIRGLDALAGDRYARVQSFEHATTLVTNALIERRGARVALVATRGFRDLLDIRQEFLYDINDLSPVFPEALVPRELRWELGERVDRNGQVLLSPSAEEVDEIVAGISNSGAEAVAVCLIHAYRNPVHEQLIADALTQRMRSLPVSLSSVVCPEIREFERTCTTAANAFVQPLAEAYLAELCGSLKSRGLSSPIRVLASGGTNIAADQAASLPIHILESGPAAGAVAAGFVGRLAGVSDLVAFDMGGTTAKISIVTHGEPDYVASIEAARTRRFERGSGIPLLTPSVDLIEIGAGGGSIAWIDELGLLRVGPRSAGSSPGPACYGFGGIEPTVTDANLVLGLLDAEFFLGGEMSLDLAAARNALTSLGQQMGGLDAEDAARAVHRLVNENMASAARVHLVERGRDARSLAMVAYGGGGPLHGPGVAQALGCTEVLVPPISGVLSALGLLVSSPAIDLSHSFPAIITGESVDWSGIHAVIADMVDHARERLVAEGNATSSIQTSVSVDCRYVGQMHEVSVPVPPAVLDAEDQDGLVAEFARTYAVLFAAPPMGAAVEALTWRVRAAAPPPPVTLPRLPAARSLDPTVALKRSRSAVVDGGGRREVPVYDRYKLAPGMALEGPSLVEERETTLLVPAGTIARVDAHGIIRVANTLEDSATS